MVADTDLLYLWREGDGAAGEELIGRYFDSICRFFRSKLGDDVDDVIQRTFLDCVESHARVRGDFRVYLFAIAHHRLFDHLRALKRSPERIDIGETSLIDLGTTPSQRVARNQEEQLLLNALARISLDHQVVLELAYWEELSGHEISEVLGIPANTVRSRLSRGLEALRHKLAELAASPALATSTSSSIELVVARAMAR